MANNEILHNFGAARKCKAFRRSEKENGVVSKFHKGDPHWQYPRQREEFNSGKLLNAFGGLQRGMQKKERCLSTVHVTVLDLNVYLDSLETQYRH